MCVGAGVDLAGSVQRIVVHTCSQLGELGAATALEERSRFDMEDAEWMLILWLDPTCVFDGCKNGGVV
jgi:hypothetical protein